MIKALVPLANGVEEMEAVIVIDVLRRARWDVVSAGLTRGNITASRGVKLVADADWREINPMEFDVLVLPGGREGARALSTDPGVQDTIRSFVQAGKWVAAICAGPLALQTAGVLRGRRATCHPAVRDELTEARRVDDRVAVDGRLVTSQGPGTAFEFALALVRLVDGPAAADAIAPGLVLPPPTVPGATTSPH